MFRWLQDRKQLAILLGLLIVLNAIMIYFFLPPDAMYWGHDSVFHMLRLDALIKSIENGTFPLYIDYDSFKGYGYATKWFYSDFLLIPFGLWGVVTSKLFAYKSLLFVSSVLCGMFTYICVNRIYKNAKVAVIAALLYTFCSYRLYDMFERTALGETMSFTLIPLVFLGIYEIVEGDYKKWYILAISFSLLIYTHLISTLLMLSVILLFTLINYKSIIKEPKRISYLCLSAIVCLFLTAYYLFPMIEQMLSNTFYFNGGKRMGSVEDSTLSPLIMSLGLMKGLPIKYLDLIGPAIGILLTIPLLFRIFVREKSEDMRNADMGVIIGLIYTIACLAFFPWGIFPFSKLSLIQLAYRLFTISSFFFAIGGAYYLCSVLSKEKSYYAILGIISIYVVVMSVYESKVFHEEIPLKSPSLEDSRFTIGNGEYLPIKMPTTVYPNKNKDRVEYRNEDTELGIISKNKGITQLHVELKSADVIELPLLYYKGYEATINNKAIPLKESDKGLIELNIQESGHIQVWYTGTLIQKISFYLTIISFVLLLAYIYMNRKREDA